jgi:hypothetical protein
MAPHAKIQLSKEALYPKMMVKWNQDLIKNAVFSAVTLCGSCKN